MLRRCAQASVIPAQNIGLNVFNVLQTVFLRLRTRLFDSRSIKDMDGSQGVLSLIRKATVTLYHLLAHTNHVADLRDRRAAAAQSHHRGPA